MKVTPQRPTAHKVHYIRYWYESKYIFAHSFHSSGPKSLREFEMWTITGDGSRGDLANSGRFPGTRPSGFTAAVAAAEAERSTPMKQRLHATLQGELQGKRTTEEYGGMG